MSAYGKQKQRQNVCLQTYNPKISRQQTSVRATEVSIKSVIDFIEIYRGSMHVKLQISVILRLGILGPGSTGTQLVQTRNVGGWGGAQLTTNGIKADIIGEKECSWRLGAVSELLAYALIGCRAKIVDNFVAF